MHKNKEIKNLEEFIKKSKFKRNLSDIILFALALGVLPGLVLVGAAMGNAVKIIKFHDKNKKFKDRQIRNSINYLHRRNLIEYTSNKDGVGNIRITKKGKEKIRSFSIEYLKVEKQKKWDGKWRVVMFDFPVRYKKVRNSFRFKLKQIGFIQLQKSVWIYPYPCTDELLFIADYYKVSKYVDILTVEEIIGDKKLKNAFNLNEC